MNDKPIAAEQTGATTIPAATLYETVVKPTRAFKTINLTLPQGLNTVINSARDFAAFGKANLEAVAASGQIWSAGVQDLTKQLASTMNASKEASVASFKALVAAKSVKEAIDLQAAHNQAAAARAVVESKKLTDASIKLTEQALAPLTARVAVAVEIFAKAA
jgi:phasin family protein